MESVDGGVETLDWTSRVGDLWTRVNARRGFKKGSQERDPSHRLTRNMEALTSARTHIEILYGRGYN